MKRVSFMKRGKGQQLTAEEKTELTRIRKNASQQRWRKKNKKKRARERGKSYRQRLAEVCSQIEQLEFDTPRKLEQTIRHQETLGYTFQEKVVNSNIILS
jgi:hypothetical protein